MDRSHRCNSFSRVSAALIIVVYIYSIVSLKYFISYEFSLSSNFIRHLQWSRCRLEGEILVDSFHFLNPSKTSFVVNRWSIEDDRVPDCSCSSSKNLCCINDKFLSLRSSSPNNMSDTNLVNLLSPNSDTICSIVHVILGLDVDVFYFYLLCIFFFVLDLLFFSNVNFLKLLVSCSMKLFRLLVYRFNI